MKYCQSPEWSRADWGQRQHKPKPQNALFKLQTHRLVLIMHCIIVIPSTPHLTFINSISVSFNSIRAPVHIISYYLLISIGLGPKLSPLIFLCHMHKKQTNAHRRAIIILPISYWQYVIAFVSLKQSIKSLSTLAYSRTLSIQITTTTNKSHKHNVVLTLILCLFFSFGSKWFFVVDLLLCYVINLSLIFLLAKWFISNKAEPCAQSHCNVNKWDTWLYHKWIWRTCIAS